jgi:carbon-monoxide dehydrogenase large subunit
MRNDDPRAVERVEDLRLLRGRGTFVADLIDSEMLHIVFVRSQVAHGHVRLLDATAARQLPGVHAVLTADDIGMPIPRLPLRLAPIAGVERFMQPVIAREKVRYVGEVLAIVVAESRATGEDAADLVEIDIEPLPAVVDCRASESGGVILHEEHATNIATNYRVGKGDTDAAFARAEYTRKAMLRSNRQTAAPMETRGLVGDWDAANGKLTIEGAAKVPHTTRKMLSAMLDIPTSAIEMIEVDIGGGFGVRGEFHPEDFLVPFTARALGRKVKWIEDRREHLMSANHSREMACELEIACMRDGTILGLRGKLWGDMGAWIRPNSGVVPAKAAQFIPGAYRIPSLTLDVVFALTNKTPVGTYRGPGRVEANFFRERLIDMAAADLGLDPLEMRLANLIAPADMPWDLGNLVPYEKGAEYDTGDFPAALERAADEIGYVRLKGREGRLIDGRYHGVAVTACAESSGSGPREHARMRLTEQGRIEIFVGSSNMGQGLETVFAQIAAEELGLPLDLFEVFHGSTTHLEEGLGTYASRAVVMGGSAVLLAARNFKSKWSEVGGGSLTAEALGHAGGGDWEIDVQGVFENTRLTWTSGAHAAHVSVDPATGHVDVHDYVAVEDIGHAINPALVHAQAIGGVVQGLGGAFLDHIVYDQEGQLLTGSYADYLLPTASDFPNVRAVTLEEHKSPSNPLGAKGAGEGPIVMVAATIGNAIAAALRPLGAEITETPFTPPRIVASIKGRAKGTGDG